MQYSSQIKVLELGIPVLIGKGENLAYRGEITQAITLFEQINIFSPTAVISPQVKAIELGVPGLVSQGEDLAKQGEITQAIVIFQQANIFSPTTVISPQAKAIELGIPVLVSQGEDLAKQGEIAQAITVFEQVNTLSPTTIISPEAKALFYRGQGLAQQGEVNQAIALFQQTQSYTLEARPWNNLCWWGSLWNQAQDVMFACEQAVALTSDDGSKHDSRGVARALTGDYSGAVDDFEVFVVWSEDTVAVSKRIRWIKELKAGHNPFTPEELAELREE